MSFTAPNIQTVKVWLSKLHDQISSELEELDGSGRFKQDVWSREPTGDLGAGGGDSRVMTDGTLFEQAGINFSHVSGESLPASATAQRPALAGRSYEAMGVSLVLHPKNPYVPTAHANVRFFVAQKPDADPIWWFGGGYDLTPYYGFAEDARHWHQTAYEACLPFGEQVYPKCKNWCDEYFYLKHRQEPRGVGGLFFDDWNEPDFANSFGLTQAVGESFMPAYAPIAQRRRDLRYGERERQFQLYRRGRYVEFNLIYDRGTLFGLQSGGRTESILMSLPPLTRWEYGYQPEPGSPEAALYSEFLKPRNWLEQS